MSFSPLNILVTGGAGYIGSHTAHQLINAGHRVTVVDTLYSGHLWAIPENAAFHQIDAGNREGVLEIMRANAFDAIIHFAGHIVVPESVEHPGKYYQNNVVASFNLIECAQKSGIGLFVFSSSAAVYGNPLSIPVNEDAPLAPINPYGRTKLVTEWTLQDIASGSSSNKPLRYVALRYFNVAGAQIEGHLGQSTPEATHLIKVACEAACQKRAGVEIFGTDYDTPDGTCIRDYIHVEDLAAAHLKALDYLDAGEPSTIINCGYGHGYSVRQVLDTVQKINGTEFPIQESSRRPGDPAQLIADNQKIRNLLQWTPRYDSLEVICETALNWERNGNQSVSATR